MKVWCMFDNHTFAQVPITDRDTLLARIKELIERKRGASFFVRDESDATLNSLNWHSRDSFAGAKEWADRVLEEHSFCKLMMA